MLEDILMHHYNDNVTFSYHQHVCICILKATTTSIPISSTNDGSTTSTVSL